MKRIFLIFGIILFFLSSCQMLPGSDQQYDDNSSNSFKLYLNPVTGTMYHYEIVNSTEVVFEFNGEKIETINKSTSNLNYEFNRDSIGNLLLSITFGDLQISSKKGDTETHANAQNASFSNNPVDVMLGALKDVKLTATITPTGEVINIEGYQELATELMKDLPTDLETRKTAQAHFDKIIGKGIIENNLSQLFGIFPDSTIRRGDKWKLNSKQEGEFNFNVNNFFQLEKINEQKAFISSTSQLKSDNTPVTLMGYSVTPSLNGEQEGEYTIETKTGMLLKSDVQSKVEGDIQLMGLSIPIVINTKLIVKRIIL